MKTTKVFSKNIIAYKSGAKYIINQGSARSGKTWSILQLLLLIAHTSKKPRVISVVSQTMPHLRRGAIRDFLNILMGEGKYSDRTWSKGSFTYTINETIIEFFSADSSDKIYGAARDILFVNEVNSIPEETFRQLVIRTRGAVFVDFNPTHEFYIHTDYMKRDSAEYIHSTFLDNDYLDESIKIELIEAGKRNKNFQKVFVEGVVGEVEGAVFTNWEIGEFDTSIPYLFGQDFGFHPDPTTLIKIAVNEKRRRIYIDEQFYKTKLSEDEIYQLNSTYAKNKLIVADSAEPRIISELKRKGLNIIGAKKGQGSVSSGILTMLNYDLIVTERSENVIRELKNYIWLDKRGSLVIDDFNHTLDAIRYGVQHVVSKSTAFVLEF